MLAASYMGALVVMGVVLLFVLGTETMPPTWFVVGVLAAGVVAHFLIGAVGYRPQPLEPGMAEDEAVAEGRVRYQSSMTLRFAIAEVIAILSLVLAFVVQGSWWMYALGAVVSFILMAMHVWPGSGPVGKSADALESKGQPSYLREQFGYAVSGPILPT